MVARKIAVVGGGISGITAAHILAKRHDVTIFERADYLGGHTNTRDVVDSTGKQIPVDTGFIVFNRVNYPNFLRLITELGVAYQSSDMSFAFMNQRTGFKYVGPRISDALRAPERLLDPRFIKLLIERSKFNSILLRDLANNTIGSKPLSEYLQRSDVSDFLIDNYIVPLINAIWSKPTTASTNFPAATFAHFFKNHGMLELANFPLWLTIVGGSRSYIEAFVKAFPGQIRLNSAVTSVERRAEMCHLNVNGESLGFDDVVIAAHADQALKLLKDPTALEVEVLSPWSYSKNTTTLHSDPGVVKLPRRYWASWNVVDSGDTSSAVHVHYHMNQLQSLATRDQFFVSLNPTSLPDRGKVHYSTLYEHPIFTTHSVATQAKFNELNGQRNTYYCGAYQRYGFHEDGVLSGISAAKRLGVEW